MKKSKIIYTILGIIVFLTFILFSCDSRSQNTVPTFFSLNHKYEKYVDVSSGSNGQTTQEEIIPPNTVTYDQYDDTIDLEKWVMYQSQTGAASCSFTETTQHVIMSTNGGGYSPPFGSTGIAHLTTKIDLSGKRELFIYTECNAGLYNGSTYCSVYVSGDDSNYQQVCIYSPPWNVASTIYNGQWIFGKRQTDNSWNFWYRGVDHDGPTVTVAVTTKLTVRFYSYSNLTQNYTAWNNFHVYPIRYLE